MSLSQAAQASQFHGTAPRLSHLRAPGRAAGSRQNLPSARHPSLRHIAQCRADRRFLARLRTGFRSLSVMGLPLPCMRSGRSLWLQNDHSAERLGTPKALVVRPVRGMRGRCRGCASRQRADGRTSPSADRIQRRSRMFPGRMRAGTQRPPLPRGEVCAQRSGRARIHRNWGLTPYGCQAAGRAGRSARSVALSAYHEA